GKVCGRSCAVARARGGEGGWNESRVPPPRRLAPTPRPRAGRLFAVVCLRVPAPIDLLPGAAMFGSIRTPVGGLFLLLATACVSAPASAPVPEGASPSEVRAAALQDQCRRARSQMDCYSGALLGVLEQQGVTEAMETLERLADRDPGV